MRAAMPVHAFKLTGWFGMTIQTGLKLLGHRCTFAGAKRSQGWETRTPVCARDMNTARTVAGLAAMFGIRHSRVAFISMHGFFYHPHGFTGMAAGTGLNTFRGVLRVKQALLVLTRLRRHTGQQTDANHYR